MSQIAEQSAPPAPVSSAGWKRKKRFFPSFSPLIEAARVAITDMCPSCPQPCQGLPSTPVTASMSARNAMPSPSFSRWAA